MKLFSSALISLFSLLAISLSAGVEKNSTICFPVGKLGARWEFGSDHLPVGGHASNDRDSDINFVCWNILDRDYLHWIENNAQGLKESAIMRDNHCFYSQITVREQKILEQILSMLKNEKRPFHIMALQEVNPTFFKVLKQALPDHIQVVVADDFEKGDIFLYNARRLYLVQKCAKRYAMHKNGMLLMRLQDRATSETFDCFQSHVTGGEDNGAALGELAQFVMTHFDPAHTTLIMGDQNRSSDYFMPPLQRAAEEKGLQKTPFAALQIPYPTHVNTLMEASWIDNLFVFSPSLCIEVFEEGSDFFEAVNLPIELMWSQFPLQETIQQARQAFAELIEKDTEAASFFEDAIRKWRIAYLWGAFDLKSILDVLIQCSKNIESFHKELFDLPPSTGNSCSIAANR